MAEYTTRAEVRHIGKDNFRVVVHVFDDDVALPQLGYQKVFKAASDDRIIVTEVAAAIRARLQAYEDKIAKDQLDARAANLAVTLTDQNIVI